MTASTGRRAPLPHPEPEPTAHTGPEIEALIDERLARLDLPARVALLTGATFWRLPAEPSIGLRQIVTSDGPIGVRGERVDERDHALALPCPSLLGATFDPELVGRLGDLLAAQSRARGVHVLLAPGVNLHRSARHGRAFECFAEDPLLSAVLGVAYLRGVQAGGVGATVKHYVGNESETERMTVDIRLSDRALHELYLAPFEATVAAGAWLVMAAYNGVDGAPMCASPLLTDPLKTTWGFDGVVVSDWTGARETVPSGRSGLDVVMPGPDGPWGDELLAAVRDGQVPAEAVADKVRRVLRLAGRVGALNGVAPAVPTPQAPADPVEHRDLLRAAAAAGTTLLRNTAPAPVPAGGPVLPLPAGVPIALLGPRAARLRVQGAGSARVFPRVVPDPLSTLVALGPITHTPGAFLDDRPTPLAADDLTAGVTVHLRDRAGRVLRSEHRGAGELVWDHDPLAAGAAEITVAAGLRITETGRWQVAVGGVGHYVLELGGRAVLDVSIDPDPAADGPAWPPYREIELDLTAGSVVSVGVRYRPRPGRTDAPSLYLAARRPRRDPDVELEHAVALAAAAGAAGGAAVVVVGTGDSDATAETEGHDRATLALPGRQDELVTRVAAVNPRTVVVLNCGSPVLLPWFDEVAAVLHIGFGGQEAAGALADVLGGTVEPGGRLPSTWPRTDADALPVTPTGGRLDYAEDLAVGHRADPAVVGPPRLPFGHGLGYTAWALESLQVDGTTAVVALRNTGVRPGRQVVQAYLSRPDSAVARPHRWLAGFTAVTAAPGETVVARIGLAPRAFAHHGPDGWAVEPGPFVVHVGFSAADTPLTGPVLPPDGDAWRGGLAAFGIPEHRTTQLDNGVEPGAVDPKGGEHQ